MILLSGISQASSCSCSCPDIWISHGTHFSIMINFFTRFDSVLIPFPFWTWKPSGLFYDLF
jgi:hypothetical protein